MEQISSTKDITSLKELYQQRSELKKKFEKELGYDKVWDKRSELSAKRVDNERNYNKIVASENMYPSSIAGIKKCEKMTLESANGGKVNPKYDEHYGYKINCQSCVVCYEARLRGYNMYTMPNVKGSALEKLQSRYRDAWINPETGDYAEPIPEGKEVKTPKECYEFLMKNVEEGKRYNLGMDWKGHSKDGHVVTIYKENGDLILYDPQNGQKFVNKAMGKDYINKIKYQKSSYGTKYNVGVDLYRVDNLAFNPEFMNDIMKGY